MQHFDRTKMISLQISGRGGKKKVTSHDKGRRGGIAKNDFHDKGGGGGPDTPKFA